MAAGLFCLQPNLPTKKTWFSLPRVKEEECKVRDGELLIHTCLSLPLPILYGIYVSCAMCMNVTVSSSVHTNLVFVCCHHPLFPSSGVQPGSCTLKSHGVSALAFPRSLHTEGQARTTVLLNGGTADSNKTNTPKGFGKRHYNADMSWEVYFEFTFMWALVMLACVKVLTRTVHTDRSMTKHTPLSCWCTNTTHCLLLESFSL